MSVDTRAEGHVLLPGELDALALAEHGRPYRLLTDTEAARIWDLIEERERNEGEP